MYLIGKKTYMKGFTLVELMVSILISVILLGGIFYFLSDTILGISRASAQSRFLGDFYSFTTILDTGELRVLHDYDIGDGFDVAILTSLDNTSGVVIGVLDRDTLQLSWTGAEYLTYHNSILWYRSLSETEITQVLSTPEIVYDYSFQNDKIFQNFNLKDFQLQMYNSWTTMDMYLHIFPDYREALNGEAWSGLSKESLFEYSLTF